MRTLDRIFGWLLVGAALLQCIVSAYSYWQWSPTFTIFAVGMGIGQLFLGAINLVRAERRHDLVLARLCVFGNLLWSGLITVYFAVSHAALRRLPVSRTAVVLGNLAVVLALALLSMRSRKRSRPM